MRFRTPLFAFLFLSSHFLQPSFFAQKIELRTVAVGIQAPIEVAFSPDTARAFVVSQLGAIWPVDLASGQIAAQPFLDLTGKVFHNWSETGLLGLAFDPDFAQNGHFFCFFNDLDTASVIARFTATGPDFVHSTKAEASTRVDVLRIPQWTVQHKGGCLRFGPDGFLWASTGDGSSGFDPLGDAQNGQSLRGKMLRIDVKNGLPYSIPPSNPFVGSASKRPEIWALGLRNPFKFSFDSKTGDLWIGDLGQAQGDEIDFEPAGSAGGSNWGWRCFEGPLPFDSSAACGASGPFSPEIFAYQNTATTMGWCRTSVTGGAVFHSNAHSRLAGRYVFGDFCHSKIWSLKKAADGKMEAEEAFDGSALNPQFTAIGESRDGRLFALGWATNALYEIEDFCKTQLAIQLGLTFSDSVLTVQTLGQPTEIEWFLDGEKIAATTAPTFSPTVSGVYSAHVFDANGCFLESISVAVVLSGVEDFSPFFAKTWPNPTENGRFFIETIEKRTSLEAQIFDSTGRLVFQKTFFEKTEIDLGSAAAGGVFQLFLTDEKGRRGVKKVVVGR